MKLELKHLVGYLPYGLEMISMNHFEGDEIPWVKWRLHSLSINRPDNPNIDEWWNEEGDNYYIESDFKPILKPLSDLTERHFNAWGISEKRFYKQLENGDLPYIVINELYEEHFDVHNLIENELAINIHEFDLK